MRVTAYQTLEDKGNPDHVEEFGPFKCTRSDAWLGHGYYLWDSHIELAHWWGKRGYYKGYMICKCRCTLDESCWDLHGNGEHRIELHGLCEEIIKAKISTREKLLLPEVIEFIKNKGAFVYDAIRALGVNTRSIPYQDPKTVYRLKFVSGNQAFVDLYPPVQICLIDKTALSLRNYHVVHPDEYVEYYG